MTGISTRQVHIDRCIALACIWKENQHFPDVQCYAKRKKWRYTRLELRTMVHRGVKYIWQPKEEKYAG